LRLTNVERLAELRRRCAATENKSTLRHILEAAQELEWISAEGLREEVSALVARVETKIAALVPAAPKRKQAARVNVTDRARGEMSPAVKMRSTEWQLDEFGNRSRTIWNAVDGPTPP
jgi:hypothetical protein